MIIYWRCEDDFVLVNHVDGTKPKILMTRIGFNEFKLWGSRMGFEFILIG
jgi:hypothetical protein